MISLFGGRYHGKFADCEPLKPGQYLSVVHADGHEVYQIREDGIGQVADPKTNARFCIVEELLK